MVEIRMEGPGMNCLGTTMMNWLLSQLEVAGSEPVLLTGAGRAFSAGLDLREVSGLDAAGMQAFLETLDRLVRAVYEYTGPLVAWVNGHAIAGGCILALAADAAYTTADTRARIGLNEVALGLRFPPCILEMVRARIDTRHLEEVVLGAALHAPVEAAGLGLVTAVSQDPEADARAHLARLAAHPPDTYKAAKADLRGGVGRGGPLRPQ